MPWQISSEKLIHNLNRVHELNSTTVVALNINMFNAVHKTPYTLVNTYVNIRMNRLVLHATFKCNLTWKITLIVAFKSFKTNWIKGVEFKTQAKFHPFIYKPHQCSTGYVIVPYLQVISNRSCICRFYWECLICAFKVQWCLLLISVLSQVNHPSYVMPLLTITRDCVLDGQKALLYTA